MSRLPKKTQWKRAALLLAEGRKSDQKIADEIGVHKTTLERWKHHADFEALITEASQELNAEALKFSIARREGRIAVQHDLQNRLLTVIEERAREAEQNGSEIPGMKTGLVCKTLKGIGKGEDFQVVEVYEADTPTVKALIALHEQAAKEMGQFEEAQLKVRANLADIIADARKRAAEAKRYAISPPNATVSQKETKERVN